MTIFNCKREGDPVRDAVKPVLEVMLKEGATQEEVASALQTAQKELVLGCEGCWIDVRKNVLWVHAYLEPEAKVHEKLKRMGNSDISALCFIYKPAGIAVEDDVAVNFYGGTKVTNGQEEHWGVLVPKLANIPNDKWLTTVLAKHEVPIFKLYLNDGDLIAEPTLPVHEAYKCVFDGSEGRAHCAYVHIGYPGHTSLLDHVGPAGCYLLLSNKSVDVPRCLISHLRAFVQTLVTAQLSVLSKHLVKGEQLRADQLAESHKKERSRVEELKKYESMYNQLLRPLRSLTERVRETQEDAHKIAAIIHDPLDVLLERQSAIAELFIKGEVVKVPPHNARVVIRHEPKDYTGKTGVAAGISAELLRRLIPELAEKLTAKTRSDAFREIVGRLKDWSERGENAYSDFCKAFRRFLNTESWDTSLIEAGGHFKSWEGIWNALQVPSQVDGIAIQFLDITKKRLFTLYKPSDATEALTWDVMRAYLCIIKVENGGFLKAPEQLGNGMILPRGANPLNTHGSLVAFIGRVVAQHLSHNKGLKTLDFSLQMEGSVSHFVVTSTKQWVPDLKEFAQLLDEQIRNRDSRARSVREFGDREQPFVDLIERVPLEVKITANPCDSILCLCVGGLTFKFSDGYFTMVSKCEVAS